MFDVNPNPHGGDSAVDRGKAIMLELDWKKGKGKYEFCFGGLLAGGIVPAV